MYKIIGADQKEYGPITADQLRQWIAEGRVNAATQALAEGDAEWKTLGDLPEFADALRSRSNRPAGPPAFPAMTAPPAKTSGMAIASLVLGIAGLFTCGVSSLVGVVLGIMSMNQIKKSNGALGGHGLALAGTIVSGFMLFFGIAFSAGLFLPAFAQAKTKAQSINCVNNMKQLALAMRIYTSDNKDQFPAATKWCDAILSNAGTAKIFQCPAGDQGQRSHYAFNARLANANTDKIDPTTVMLFEVTGGWNQSGGKELMLTQPRHARRFIVALADGSVQQLTEARLNELRWEP